MLLYIWYLSTLWSSSTSFWYYVSVIDYYILITTQCVVHTFLGYLRDTFLSIVNYIEMNVTVEFFIYFIYTYHYH